MTASSRHIRMPQQISNLFQMHTGVHQQASCGATQVIRRQPLIKGDLLGLQKSAEQQLTLPLSCDHE